MFKSSMDQQRLACAASYDYEEAERRCSMEVSDGETPETIFDRHWGLNLLERTMNCLESL